MAAAGLNVLGLVLTRPGFRQELAVRLWHNFERSHSGLMKAFLKSTENIYKLHENSPIRAGGKLSSQAIKVLEDFMKE